MYTDTSSSFFVPAIEGKAQHYDAIIIGAGQAGMSMSYCLKQKGLSHIVLEKSNCVANNWRHERWDKFCLVTPNWQCQLPGYPYQGDNPHGFMVKEEIIDYLQSYYNSFKPPVIFNSPVISLTKKDNVFHIQTTHKHYTSEQVVIACGSYHQPHTLPFAHQLPKTITQIHSRDYKNADQLPDGDVMVIGTGQSGCQIAEDLHLQGRKVHLSVGTAPRVNRRYRGRDVVDWLEDMGYYATTIDEHPDGKNACHATNHYVTGRDGGRDLNLRVLAKQGMQLYGKIQAYSNGTLHFDDDLKENLDNADAAAERIRTNIEDYINANNIEAPIDNNLHSSYLPQTQNTLKLSSSNIRSIVWATGFKMHFDWIKLPVFDEHGHPDQIRGATCEDGMYFLGLNWMHTWGSGRFFHVGRDAEFLSEEIANYAVTRRNVA